MERLIKDASKMKDIQKELNVTVDEGDLSFGNIVNAISVMQKELGIAGTTAEEAEKTLQGSLSSMKASWNNFLSGSGDLSQFIDTVDIFVRNVIRITAEAVPQIINDLTANMPKLLEVGGQLIQSIADGIMQNMPFIIETTFQIIQNMLDAFIQNLPQIMQMGIDMVIQLINGITQMLPSLIPIAIQAILTLVDGLLDNIDKIVEAAIELIIALTEGLIEALPTLIDKAPEIVQKLVDAIIRMLPRLAEAGGQLIGKLVSGIIVSLPKVALASLQILNTIWNVIKDIPNKMLEIGTNVVKGIWDGISSSIGWIKDKLKSWVGDVVGFIKNIFGIHSPSRVMRDQVGQWLPKGIAVGIDANTDSALDAIDDMNDAIMKKMKSAVNVETNKVSASATLKSNANYNSLINLNATFDGVVDMDGTKVGRMTAPAVVRTIKAGGLV